MALLILDRKIPGRARLRRVFARGDGLDISTLSLRIFFALEVVGFLYCLY